MPHQQWDWIASRWFCSIFHFFGGGGGAVQSFASFAISMPSYTCLLHLANRMTLRHKQGLVRETVITTTGTSWAREAGTPWTIKFPWNSFLVFNKMTADNHAIWCNKGQQLFTSESEYILGTHLATHSCHWPLTGLRLCPINIPSLLYLNCITMMTVKMDALPSTSRPVLGRGGSSDPSPPNGWRSHFEGNHSLFSSKFRPRMQEKCSFEANNYKLFQGRMPLNSPPPAQWCPSTFGACIMMSDKGHFLTNTTPIVQ